jgi:hypothetical protein
MAAIIEQTPTSPDQDERARNRFAARRICAAERADVSVQESQALSRAAAESLANERRRRVQAESDDGAES